MWDVSWSVGGEAARRAPGGWREVGEGGDETNMCLCPQKVRAFCPKCLCFRLLLFATLPKLIRWLRLFQNSSMRRPLFDPFWADKYPLLAHEIKIAQEKKDQINAYITQEDPQVFKRHQKCDSAVILLPDADGWKSKKIRNLADRLAVLCATIVLVPDLLRGQPNWNGTASIDGFDTWMSGLPPKRVLQDVRESSVFLRADHRVSQIGIVGVGMGGSQALRVASADIAIMATSVIAWCPMRLAPGELRPKIPTMCILGSHSTSKGMDQFSICDGALFGDHSSKPPVYDSSISSRGKLKRREGQKDATLTSLRKLRVEELRQQLVDLGLSSSGLKSELVERLHAAIKEGDYWMEEDESPDLGVEVGLRTEPQHLVLTIPGSEEMTSLWTKSSEVMIDDEGIDGDDFSVGWEEKRKAEVRGERNMGNISEGEWRAECGPERVHGKGQESWSVNDALLFMEGWLSTHLRSEDSR